MHTRDRLFIGGEWIVPATTQTIDVISPHTEQVIARVPEAREADVDRAVAAARQAFDDGPWPRMTPAERADVMKKLVAVVAERAGHFAETITREMGCPISWSHLGQVLSAQLVLDYYEKLTREYPFEERRQGMLGATIVRREAVGVAAGIIPWNVPLFIIALKLGPALASGSTIVLKPAPETPLDALLLADACEAAGVPKGVVSVLPAGREVGEYLVTHAGVDKVGFTGSTAAGRRVAALCGERLKRVTLELGGKSACIVLDDADLGSIMPGILDGALMNTGQACAATTRILASRARYDAVVDALTAAVSAQHVGDPLDPATQCGPLVAERQRQRVEGYIEIGRNEGARITCGGGRPKALRTGWYVEPTVFADVDNHMRIAREEIFGPVLCVIPYDDEADAIRIANDSEYGLSGSVWTSDVDRGVEVARRVRTGTYTVNGFMMEFGAPFGGYKASGIGRELGPEGLQAYLEPKQINCPMGYEPTLR